MTIKDIARETGYSIGTVSRVLNDHPNVSEKARKAVLEVVDRTGFILNASAKNLKQVQSDNIVVVIKGTFNELFASMVQQMQMYFRGTRYTLITEYVDEEANEVSRARKICLEKKAIGLLVLGGNKTNFLADFDKIDIPTVLVTNFAGNWGFPNLSSVSTDDAGAAKCAVEYLLGNGHKKVALIGGTPGSDTSTSRKRGWELAQEEYGIKPCDYGPAIGGRYSYAAGYQSMKKVLEDESDITAVFAMADVTAIGAMSAIFDAGLRVPDDISVVGFDGIKVGQYMAPKLTTIEQNLERIAIRSCEILIDCLENDSRAVHEYVPFHLDCRQSVIPIR